MKSFAAQIAELSDAGYRIAVSSGHGLAKVQLAWIAACKSHIRCLGISAKGLSLIVEML